MQESSFNSLLSYKQISSSYAQELLQTKAELARYQLEHQDLRHKYDLLKLLFEKVYPLLLVLDGDGRIVELNATCKQISQYSLAEVQNQYFWDVFVQAEEVESVKANFASLSAQDFPRRHESFLVARSGDRRLIEWADTVVTDLSDKVKYVICTGNDISDRLANEDLLKQQAAWDKLIASITLRIHGSLRLEDILGDTVREILQALKVDRVVVCRISPSGNGSVIAEAVADGYSSLMGDNLDTYCRDVNCHPFPQESVGVIHDLSQTNFPNEVVQSLQCLQIRACLTVPILVDQGSNEEESSSEMLWGLLVVQQCNEPRHWQQPEINLIAAIATQLEIAVQKAQLYEQLQNANLELIKITNLDYLTQIANRRCFDQQLNFEWQRLAREKAPLSLIMCDIDFFKAYNDTYDHLGGDECLRQVSQAIAGSVRRPADLAARYGGEEFAIILPNTEIDGALHVAEAIQLAVKNLKIVHDPSPVSKYVTLSFGIASIMPVVKADPTVLVRFADHALFRAKELGRDRIYCIG
ncbi:diguanylate cyclase [Tumidithrix elongata RA019]|uniref:Diguanylate cyclase n=1 Tax=Tumidithrix elongata BACA0141 TaxID=2716417 RepID=A0AAW9PTE1_9CYAN|nr:diguanylate cyclase [Tumidithrix elongata RA019]